MQGEDAAFGLGAPFEAPLEPRGRQGKLKAAPLQRTRILRHAYPWRSILWGEEACDLGAGGYEY